MKLSREKFWKTTINHPPPNSHEYTSTAVGSQEFQQNRNGLGKTSSPTSSKTCHPSEQEARLFVTLKTTPVRSIPSKCAWRLSIGGKRLFHKKLCLVTMLERHSYKCNRVSLYSQPIHTISMNLNSFCNFLFPYVFVLITDFNS